MSETPAMDTTFVLDERQRAMLAQMGVRVWLPQPQPVNNRAALAPVNPMAPAAPAAPVAPAVKAQTAPSHDGAAPLALPPGISAMDWPALHSAIAHCRACALCQSRTNPLPGQGAPDADWLVVGDAPSQAEDRQAQPFVDEAGLLLDNMLKAVGVARSGAAAQGAYLVNALKCRPPQGRVPQPDELALCETYLRRQVALVQPKVILALGRLAAQALLNSTEPLGKLRGQLHHYQGVPVVVSYPLSYLLRNPQEKAKAWADLCLALQAARA